MKNNIQKIRYKLGMSRKELAQGLRVTVGAISNYENGARFPRPFICYRLIDLAKSRNIKIKLEDIYPRFE